MSADLQKIGTPLTLAPPPTDRGVNSADAVRPTISETLLGELGSDTGAGSPEWQAFLARWQDAQSSDAPAAWSEMYFRVRCDELRLSLMGQHPDGYSMIPAKYLQQLALRKLYAAQMEESGGSVSATLGDREAGYPVFYLGDVEWKVYPTGGGRGYQYNLRAPGLNLRLHKADDDGRAYGPTSPQLLLTIHGEYLLAHGFAAAAALARKIAGEIGGGEDWGVSALHLACDVPFELCDAFVDCLHLAGHKLNRRYGPFEGGKRLETVDNLTPTARDLTKEAGSGKPHTFTVYNKRRYEQSKQGSPWVAYWRAIELPETMPVMRIETRYRRKYLKDRLHLRRLSDLTPEAILGVWTDFTGRYMILAEHEAARRDRAGVDSSWLLVQESTVNESIAQAAGMIVSAVVVPPPHRKGRPVEEVSQGLQAAVGCITSALAKAGLCMAEDEEVDAVVTQVVDAAFWEHRRDVDLLRFVGADVSPWERSERLTEPIRRYLAGEVRNRLHSRVGACAITYYPTVLDRNNRKQADDSLAIKEEMGQRRRDIARERLPASLRGETLAILRQLQIELPPSPLETAPF